MDKNNEKSNATQILTENVDNDDDVCLIGSNESDEDEESGVESDDEEHNDPHTISVPVFTRSRNTPKSIYESLDYDVCENRLWVIDQKPKLTKLSVKKDFVRWIICLLIGVLTALVAASIDIVIEEVSSVKFGFLRKLVQNMKLDNTDIVIPYLYWMCTNVAFVTMGALMVTYLEPVAAGSGIPQVKCYLNGIKVRQLYFQSKFMPILFFTDSSNCKNQNTCSKGSWCSYISDWRSCRWQRRSHDSFGCRHSSWHFTRKIHDF